MQQPGINTPQSFPIPTEGACRTELRFQLETERERSQDLLQQEAESRRRVEQESNATKAAVAEAIKDLESLDRERTELRHRLQARPVP